MLERVVLPTEEDRYAQQRRQQQQQSHLSPAFAHFAGGLGFRVEGAGVGSLDSFLCRCLSYALLVLEPVSHPLYTHTYIIHFIVLQ